MWAQAALLPTLAVLVQAQTRPNLVFIMADDMGFNDVGFHGGDVPTPNLDALAGHGVILNRHYSEPACTPSRAALLTGKYPFRTGMQGSPLPAGVARGLPLTEKIFPQYFQDLGYKTHLIGKWHLGYETWEHMPTRRGFDTFFGYLNGFVGYYDSTHTQTNTRSPLWDSPPLPEGSPLQNKACMKHKGVSGLDFRRGEEPAWDEVYGRYLTGTLTEEAVEVIRGHREDGGLLLFLNHMAPHTGNLHFLREAPPGVRANFTSRQVYAEMVRWLDDSVGEVVKTLEEKGILNNTIIVFISDNGAPTEDRVWGYSNYGSNWPLRGEKMSVHDGGVRTSAVLWSSFLKPRISNDLFSITDWLPTLYSAAGGSVSDLGNIDGVDQLGTLTFATSGTRNSLVIGVDETQGIEAIIKGKWKLLKNFKPMASMKFTDLYFGESDRNSTYNVDAVKRSPIGKILGYPKVMYDEVRELASLNAFCQDQNAAVATDCYTKYCLYDILEDPTECTDRAMQFPLVVAQLSKELMLNRALMVPRNNRSFDPEAHPCLWKDYWTPWKRVPSTSRGTSFHPPLWTCLFATLVLLSASSRSFFKIYRENIHYIHSV